MVLAEGRAGGVRTKISAEDDALKLFSAKHRKEVFRRAMVDTTEYFVDAFLPLRFTDYIRRAPWNYRGGRNNKDPAPLVDSGLMKRTVESGTTMRVSATGSRGARGAVSIPLPNYGMGIGNAQSKRWARKNFKAIRTVFETVPIFEADRLAQIYADAIATEISASKLTRSRRGRERRVPYGVD